MGQLVGPFTIEDATATEAARVQLVASRIPAPIAGRMRQGATELFFAPNRKPGAAPSWAWGFRPGNGHCWIDRRAAADKQLYTIAHEWFHDWDDEVATPAQRNAIRALAGSTVGWKGGHYTKDGTNRPAEWAADAFARAIGFGAGLLGGFYTGGISSASYSQLLAIMAGGGASASDPLLQPHTRVRVRLPRRQWVSLRAWPGLAAPVIRRVGFGGRIQIGRGHTGGAWATDDGLRGSWWCRVQAINGVSIEPELWACAGEVKHPEEPQPASPDPSNG
jgi:hypothetical protein